MPVDEALEIMRRDAGSHLCVETLDALERGLRGRAAARRLSLRQTALERAHRLILPSGSA